MSRTDRALDLLSTLGVVALTALAYAALRDLAITKGEPQWAASLWPACVDVAALVAGFIAVRARRRGGRDAYAELLAVAFAVGVVAANLAGKVSLLVGGVDPLAMAVRGTPPVTMLATWHLLVHRLAHARPPSAAGAMAPDIHADITADTPRSALDAGTMAVLPSEPPAIADIGADVRGDDLADITETPPEPDSAGRSGRQRSARAYARSVLRRHGPAATSAMVATRAGVSQRHAARLLAQERTAMEQAG